MITKKTSENAGLYDKLFADASKVLSDKLHTEVTIKTLDEYLFNLETLREYEKDEQYSLRFSRLPVDEPPFVIDANARHIEIPASFKKNGIAVIGDHLAEILYFTVDRYYDTWDLLDKDVQIIVQWTYVQAGKESDSLNGISIISEKDSKVFASENKIMFGWPINNKIAGTAGTIKFSVRFFKIADEHLVFNMNTVPTTVEIKNGLNFVTNDGTLTKEAIDDSLLVSYRFKNGLGYQGGEGGAEKPDYVIPLSFYSIDEDNNPFFEEIEFEDGKTSIIKDLNEDDLLSFGLFANGNGNITYAGYKDSTTNVKDIEYFYAETKDTTPNSEKVYYTFNTTSNEYEIASVNGGFVEENTYFERIAGITADGVGKYWIMTTNTMVPSDNAYTAVTEDTPVAGKTYFIKVNGAYQIATVGENFTEGIAYFTRDDKSANWSRYEDKSKEVIVPGPTAPTNTTNEHAYIEDGRLTITVAGEPGEAPIEGKPDTLVYTLLEENAEEPMTEHSDGAFSVDISGVENIHKYDKTFTASVVATRNGANSTPETVTVRATYPTEPFEISLSATNDRHIPTTLSVSILNYDDVLFEEDGISYQWYMDEQGNEDVLIEGATEATYTISDPELAGNTYNCIVTNTINGKSASTEIDESKSISVRR